MNIEKITSTEGMTINYTSKNVTIYLSREEYLHKVVMICSDVGVGGWTWQSSGIHGYSVSGWSIDSEYNTIGFIFRIDKDGTFTEKKYRIRL